MEEESEGRAQLTSWPSEFKFLQGMQTCRLDNSSNLERHGSSRKFEPHFHRENGSEKEKFFVTVIYASETIQNCKNPTGHVGTLNYNVNIELNLRQ